MNILEELAAYIFRMKCHFSTLKVGAEVSSDRMVLLYNTESHPNRP
jgi:hypothetical protein